MQASFFKEPPYLTDDKPYVQVLRLAHANKKVIDEKVILELKISSTASRNKDYEKLVAVLNTMQAFLKHTIRKAHPEIEADVYTEWAKSNLFNIIFENKKHYNLIADLYGKKTIKIEEDHFGYPDHEKDIKKLLNKMHLGEVKGEIILTWVNTDKQISSERQRLFNTIRIALEDILLNKVPTSYKVNAAFEMDETSVKAFNLIFKNKESYNAIADRFGLVKLESHESLEFSAFMPTDDQPSQSVKPG